LARSARTLEELALRGEAELQRALEHTERARELAQLAGEAAEKMRAMLLLELDHRADDAGSVADEWIRRAREAPRDSEAIEALSFEEADELPAEEHERESIHGEL